MIIVRLLSPEPLLAGFSNHQLYSVMGADVVMESIALTKGRKLPSRFQSDSTINGSPKIWRSVINGMEAIRSRGAYFNAPGRLPAHVPSMNNKKAW
jgi:hypothetical protein